MFPVVDDACSSSSDSVDGPSSRVFVDSAGLFSGLGSAVRSNTNSGVSSLVSASGVSGSDPLVSEDSASRSPGLGAAGCSNTNGGVSGFITASKASGFDVATNPGGGCTLGIPVHHHPILALGGVCGSSGPR